MERNITNSAGARGPFAAHLYGLNRVITSGTSRMDIIGDLCDFLPSTATRNPQKACNIIKICMFLLFYRMDLLSITLHLPSSFYISLFVRILQYKRPVHSATINSFPHIVSSLKRLCIFVQLRCVLVQYHSSLCFSYKVPYHLVPLRFAFVLLTLRFIVPH